jgi:protein SCO1/2
MKTRTRKLKYAALLAMIAMLPASAALADRIEEADPHAKHRAMMNESAVPEPAQASVTLNDSVLLDQDGKSVRLVSDVIADRIVVMDFVYTTCTTVCPVLSAILSQVQSRLAEQDDTDVRLISISVDPVRDTPERLKAYADSHHSGSEWFWLTGEKTQVDEVLRGLGAYTPDFEDHPSMVLVGDPRTGTWKRFFGFPGPEKIAAAVNALQEVRQTAGTN